MSDMSDKTEEELESLAQQLQAERERRRALATSPAKVEALVQQYQAALGREGGSEWVEPTSALDAYPLGAVVTHDGKMWDSKQAMNVFEPGVRGWEEIEDD